MKPNDSLSADPLSSGVGVQPQPPQVPDLSPDTTPVNPQIPSAQNTAEPVFHTPSQSQPSPDDLSYSMNPSINPPQNNSTTVPPAQSSQPASFNPPPPINPQNQSSVYSNPAVNQPLPSANPVQPVMQTTSPLDTPPAPPSQSQPVQNTVNLGNSIAEEKPRKKLPFFLILLLILVVIVLGAVGFLAYQNYNLNKNASKQVAQTPLINPVVETDPYAGFTTFKSTILPVEFMIPSNWKTVETEEKDLANQKMIKANSPDFSYDGSSISQGYEFRIGPVNDLTKKYDSFDAFAAEENTGNLYTQKPINGVLWLVKGNEAKTLVDKSPLTAAVYSSVAQATDASGYFNTILNSIKISATPSATPATTPTVTIPATPSATPLE